MVEHWRTHPADFVRAILDSAFLHNHPALRMLGADEPARRRGKDEVLTFPRTEPVEIEIETVGVAGPPILGPTASLVIIDDMIEPELTPEQEAKLQRYLKEMFP